MFDDCIDSVTATITAYDSQGDVELTLYENGTVGGEAQGIFPVPEAHDDFFAMVQDNKPIPKRNISGKTPNGTRIKLLDARLGMKFQGVQSPRGMQIKQVLPRRVEIDSHDGGPIIDSSVTIEIDLLNAECIPRPSSEPRDSPILERDSWQVIDKIVDDHWERIDLIQEQRQSIRTAKLIVQQTDDWPPRIQLERALDRVKPLLWLYPIAQGVFPSPLRARIIEVDEEPVDWRCESWITDWKTTIGCAHIGHPVVNRNDAQILFNDGYETFLNELNRDTYRRAISWYLDALVPGRTVEARVASLASGIEQLAEGRRTDGESGKTALKIKNLIDKLTVEYEDLARFSGTFPDEAIDGSNPNKTPQYFYSKSRNFVLHGEEKVDSKDLVLDHEAMLWLFRRILVRQFVDEKNYEDLTRLNDLSPDINRFWSSD